MTREFKYTDYLVNYLMLDRDGNTITDDTFKPYYMAMLSQGCFRVVRI